MSFASDTEVHETADGLTATIAQAWEAAPGTPNGGYLAAIAMRAAGRVQPALVPASFQCSFLNRAAFGPARLQVREVRASSRVTCVRVELEQQGAPLLVANVWLSDPQLQGYDFQLGELPDTPRAEDCRDVLVGPVAPCWRGVEFRSPMPDPAQVGPQAPFFRGWHRFKDEPQQDDAFVAAGRLLFLADVRAFGPVVSQQGSNFLKLPFLGLTLDLSATFYESTAATDWFLLDARVEAARRGCMGSTLDAWSASGRRLASLSATNVCRPNPLRMQGQR